MVNKSRDSGDGLRLHLTGSTHIAPITVRYERRFLWWRW